jgi:hypothetical protein
MADIVDIEALRKFAPISGAPKLIEQAAAEIERLRAACEAMREGLEWYGEQARLARLIHSEGDAGRHALADDGGKRARAALNQRIAP